MKKILLACLMVGLCVSNMNFVSATLSTDINIGNHEIESYSDLKYLSERLDDFILKNPSSSEEEQDTFLNEVIQSSEFEMQKSMNRSAGDYLPGYNNLNSQEKKLAKQSPTKAVSVYSCASTATNKTISIYGRNGYQDNTDAFRHGYWNILMVKKIGKSWAEKWANAHEYTSSGVDKEMDLRNNKIGRDSYVSGKSDSQLSSIIVSKVNTGKMWRIIGGQLTKTSGGRNYEN